MSHKSWLPITPPELLRVVLRLWRVWPIYSSSLLGSSDLSFSPHFIHEGKHRSRKVMDLFKITWLGSKRARLFIREAGRKCSHPGVCRSALPLWRSTQPPGIRILWCIMSGPHCGSMNSHKFVIIQSLSVTYLHKYPAAFLVWIQDSSRELGLTPGLGPLLRTLAVA